MTWPLIAAGVIAGFGLAIAKQWFDRRERAEKRKAVGRQQGVEPASGPGAHSRPEVPPQATEVSSEPDMAAPSEPRKGASRQDTSETPSVEEALASGDLAKMEAVLKKTDDLIDRNRLLNRLLAGHYRLRREPKHRKAFYRVADVQIQQAAAILNAIEEAGRPRPDHLEAFKSMAIALDEDECYDEAVALCEQALSLGLVDGTKTGFEGRIARLMKSRDAKD